MSKLFFHNYYHNVIVKCHRNVNLEEMDTGKIWTLSTVSNISGAHQAKFYYGSVKKSKFSFSCHLQIVIEDVIEDPRRKTDTNFSQAFKYLYEVLTRWDIMQCISYDSF